MDGEIVFDENGRAMRRVRRKKSSDTETVDEPSIPMTTNSKRTMAEEAELLKTLQAEAAAIEKEATRAECPVPKPGGVVGRWLGFEEQSSSSRHVK